MDACGCAGIHRATFYRWIERGRRQATGAYRDVCDSITRARATGRIFLLAKIYDAAATDWRAGAWLLERRDPEGYGPTVRHRIGGDPDGPPVRAESTIDDAVLLRELAGILDAVTGRVTRNEPPPG
jgi:hypothetical protein